MKAYRLSKLLRLLGGLTLGLALVLGVFVPEMLSKSSRTGCNRKVPTDLIALHHTLCAYRIDRGAWPTSLQTLVTPDSTGWTYLDRQSLPVDPWKRLYLYEPPTEEVPWPRVYTLGADGRPGGAGEDEDVDSWRFVELPR